MTSELVPALEPDRVVPGAAADRVSLDVRLVRLVGRLPLQGREPTRRLIRICHDAVDRPGRLRARRYLRQVAAMNVVRHVVPVPFGVLATVDYDALAGRPGPTGLWIAAETCTAVLTTVSTLAACAQASVHLRLARRLRAGLRAEPDAVRAVDGERSGRGGSGRRAGGHLPPPAKVTRPGTYLRDRAVTRVLVLCALVTVAPPALIRVVRLL